VLSYEAGASLPVADFSPVLWRAAVTASPVPMPGKDALIAAILGLRKLGRPAGDAGAAQPAQHVAEFIGPAIGDDTLIRRRLEQTRRCDAAGDDLVVADRSEIDNETGIDPAVIDVHREYRMDERSRRLAHDPPPAPRHICLAVAATEYACLSGGYTGSSRTQPTAHCKIHKAGYA
jgi:hypothetical protein